LQWAKAHDIFMSIYLTNQSNSVLDLIKYGNNIRNMAKQFGFQAAKSYDASFGSTENPAEANRELLLGPSVKGHTLRVIGSMNFVLEPVAL
jgi:hypothetical protein